MLVFLLIPLPFIASAYSVYPYTDFVTESGVDVDGNYVILTFDPDAAWIGVRDLTLGVDSYSGNGASGSWYATAGHSFWCDMYPLGRGADGIVNFMNISDDVPNGSKLTLTFSCDLSPGHETPMHDFFVCYMNPSGGVEEKVQKTVGVTNVGEEYTVEFTLDRPTSSTWMYFYVQLDNWSALHNGTYSLELTSCRMKISIDSLYALQQQTGKTNQLLTEVKQQLESNGQKLDDILSGGAAGDDLIAGGDRIENAGSGLVDDIGQIQDFENQYFGELDAGWGEVISGSSISMLVAPLSFIHTYVNKIVAGVPSAYLVVFTLPMLLGIFMYIVGHPIRVRRPDPCGDQESKAAFSSEGGKE